MVTITCDFGLFRQSVSVYVAKERLVAKSLRSAACHATCVRLTEVCAHAHVTVCFVTLSVIVFTRA